MDARELKSLVHYVCTRCGEFGPAVRVAQLNAILRRADGQTYLRLGKAIAGEEYLRQREGPVSVQLPTALRELEAEGRVQTWGKQSGPLSG